MIPRVRELQKLATMAKHETDIGRKHGDKKASGHREEQTK